MLTDVREIDLPTYAYRGTECEHTFDLYQSFADDALTACIECGGPVRKVLSPVGVVFKGSGFYRNDSREKGKGSTAKGTSGKSSGTGATKEKTSADASSPSTSSAASTSGSSGGSATTGSQTSTAPAKAASA